MGKSFTSLIYPRENKIITSATNRESQPMADMNEGRILGMNEGSPPQVVFAIRLLQEDRVSEFHTTAQIIFSCAAFLTKFFYWWLNLVQKEFTIYILLNLLLCTYKTSCPSLFNVYKFNRILGRLLFSIHNG